MRTQNPELAARRRAEIADAARRVFAAKGYHDAQIADIAAELGIGHGTVYRYFKDKRAVFGEVVTLVVAKIATVVAEDAPAADTLEEYRGQIERIGQRLFDVMVAEEEIVRLIFREAPAVDDEIAAQVAASLEAFAQVTESYLINGQKKGFVDSTVNTRVASFAINAMIFEGARVVLESDDRAAAKQEWMDAVPQLFLYGVAPR